MNLYKNICASIYQFYVRKNDFDPVFVTLLLITLILASNFWALYDLLTYFLIEDKLYSLNFVYGSLIFICLINALYIYRNKEYKETYPSKSFGYKFLIYIVFTVISLAITSTMHHNRNLLKIKSSSSNFSIPQGH